LLTVFLLAYVIFVWQNEEDPKDKIIDMYLEKEIVDSIADS